MADRIHAPFDDGQIELLNGWQSSNLVHPFTCGLDHSNGHVNLVAKRKGWVCSDSECPYVQRWAYDYMVNRELFDKMTELFTSARRGEIGLRPGQESSTIPVE